MGYSRKRLRFLLLKRDCFPLKSNENTKLTTNQPTGCRLPNDSRAPLKLKLCFCYRGTGKGGILYAGQAAPIALFLQLVL